MSKVFKPGTHRDCRQQVSKQQQPRNTTDATHHRDEQADKQVRQTGRHHTHYIITAITSITPTTDITSITAITARQAGGGAYLQVGGEFLLAAGILLLQLGDAGVEERLGGRRALGCHPRHREFSLQRLVGNLQVASLRKGGRMGVANNIA